MDLREILKSTIERHLEMFTDKMKTKTRGIEGEKAGEATRQQDNPIEWILQHDYYFYYDLVYPYYQWSVEMQRKGVQEVIRIE